MTSPSSRYRLAHARTYGSVRSQLMHVYVQKLTATTLTERSAGVSGGELNHRVAPSRDGNSALFESRLPGPICERIQSLTAASQYTSIFDGLQAVNAAVGTRPA